MPLPDEVQRAEKKTHVAIDCFNDISVYGFTEFLKVLYLLGAGLIVYTSNKE